MVIHIDRIKLYRYIKKQKHHILLRHKAIYLTALSTEKDAARAHVAVERISAGRLSKDRDDWSS